MQLNKPAKITLGVLTVFPLLLASGTFLFGIYHIASFFFTGDPDMPMYFFSYLAYVLPYTFLVLLLYLGLVVFYLIHIFQNNFIDREKRFLWISILFLLNGIAMPAYWYIHIWNEKKPAHNHSKSYSREYESGAESREF